MLFLIVRYNNFVKQFKWFSFATVMFLISTHGKYFYWFNSGILFKVFRPHINWIRRKSFSRLMENVALIVHLSAAPFTDMFTEPVSVWVLFKPGIDFDGVLSRLITQKGDILFFSTLLTILLFYFLLNSFWAIHIHQSHLFNPNNYLAAFRDILWFSFSLISTQKLAKTGMHKTFRHEKAIIIWEQNWYSSIYMFYTFAFVSTESQLNSSVFFWWHLYPTH